MRSHKWRILKVARAESLSAGLLFLALIFLAPFAHAGNWTEHASKLGALSKEIAETEHHIHELIEQKRSVEDPQELQHIVKELAEKHDKLRKASEEYEAERLHVRFKHPDRNDAVERQYARYTLKSLKQMESEFGMDGRLDRIKNRVLATFPLPPTPTPKPFVLPTNQFLRGPASIDPEDAPERIRLVK